MEKKNARPNELETSAPSEAKFTGTDNPRHLRAIAALLRRPLPRETLDKEAGCANGPDLIAELRCRNLEIPCKRIKFEDRDGNLCRPGVYSFTASDRAKVHRWMATRQQARNG
ncbi:MAG: hypothetical protein AB7V34_02365 [Brachymonas sp.]